MELLSICPTLCKGCLTVGLYYSWGSQFLVRPHCFQVYRWMFQKKMSFFVLKNLEKTFQLSSVARSCPTLCDPMNCSTSGLLVHHKLPEFTQTHAHRVGDAIQPSHPLSSPSPPAPNPSKHQGLFQWVNSLHEVAEVLERKLLAVTKNAPERWVLGDGGSVLYCPFGERIFL